MSGIEDHTKHWITEVETLEQQKAAAKLETELIRKADAFERISDKAVADLTLAREQMADLKKAKDAQLQESETQLEIANKRLLLLEDEIKQLKEDYNMLRKSKG